MASTEVTQKASARSLEILERVRAGTETFRVIAGDYGLSPQRIGQIANKAGITRKHLGKVKGHYHVKRTAARKKLDREIIAMLEGGASYVEAAREIGMSRQRVSLAVTHTGWKRPKRPCQWEGCPEFGKATSFSGKWMCQSHYYQERHKLSPAYRAKRRAWNRAYEARNRS